MPLNVLSKSTASCAQMCEMQVITSPIPHCRTVISYTRVCLLHTPKDCRRRNCYTTAALLLLLLRRCCHQ